jgi:hypothetical protein
MVRDLPQFGEANRGVDVITEHGFPSFYVSGEEAFNAFAQEFFAESGITADLRSNCIFEVSGQSHC